MPSTAQRVARYLDEDLAMKEVLARGILNLRRAARWLIDKEGWDASEEAVVSALRRFAGSSDAEILDEAREALAAADVGLRSRYARLTVPRGPRLHRRVREAHRALGADDTLALLPGQTRVRVLVDGDDPERVAEKLEASKGEPGPVAAVLLSFPEGGPASHLGTAIVLNTLVQQGIRVLEVFTCEPEVAIVVDQAHARAAFEAVGQMAGFG